MFTEREQSVIEAILLEFQKPDSLARVARHAIRPSVYGKPSENWSLLNRLIMAMHGSDDCRGLKQWNQVGRYVNPGAKALHILAPRWILEEDEVSGEKVKRLRGFLAVPVFRFSDTHGQDLPQITYAPTTPPPLLDVAKAWGIDVRYEPFMNQYLGAYRPNGKGSGGIVLASHDPGVFFHELAHAGHERIEGKLRAGQWPEQEIIAEFTARLLMELYGLGGRDATAFEYIDRYARQAGTTVHSACLRVLSQVDKILRAIFATADELSRSESLSKINGHLQAVRHG